MSYRFNIDAERATGFVRISGHADAATFNQAADAMMSAPEWEPGFSTLWDIEPAAVVDITPEGMKSLVDRKLQRDRELNLSGKIAILLPRETLRDVAMLTRHLASSDDRVIEVFTDRSAAEEWLGLDGHSNPWSGE